MKLSDVRELNTEELMNLKVGDRVWYCSLLMKSLKWDGDLEQGKISEIFRCSDRRGQVIGLDLIEATRDIQGFGIGFWVVPCKHIFKPI